jgi:hypothetical protein
VRSAKELIEKIFDKDTANKAGVYSTLFGSWASVVGDRTASHTHIVELKGSVLLVEADHPSWVQIVQSNSKKYLKALSKICPDLEIHAISLFCSHNLAKKPETIIHEPPVGSKEDYEKESDTVLERVEDEELKKLLQRLERAVTKRNSRTR